MSSSTRPPRPTPRPRQIPSDDAESNQGLRAVPDYVPTLAEKLSQRGLTGRRLLAAGAAVVVLGAGAFYVSNATELPKDSRTEINASKEDALLKAFINSGKKETKVGEASITTMRGTVTITPDATDPINFRSTVGWQNYENPTDKWDNNVDKKIGYNFDEQRPNFAVLVNPMVVTFPNGDKYMGGLMADKNGKLPEVHSVDDFASKANWAFISKLDDPYSGASVNIQTEPGSEAAYPVDLTSGDLPAIFPAHTEETHPDHSRLDYTVSKTVYGE